MHKNCIKYAMCNPNEFYVFECHMTPYFSQDMEALFFIYKWSRHFFGKKPVTYDHDYNVMLSWVSDEE